MGRRAVKGFSLLELAVVAVVLSILLGVFLERLTFYQAAAERAQVEATLQGYKTALQIRMAELMLERREAELPTLETENPTRWLSVKPVSYAGEYPERPRPGNWYFDPAARQLVYAANTGSWPEAVERDGVRQLRFRVKVIYQPVQVAGGPVQGIGGIALAPVAGAPKK